MRNAPLHEQATVARDAINRSLNLLLKSLFGRKTAKIAEVRLALEEAIVAPYVQSAEPRPQRPYPVAYAPPRPVRRRAGSSPGLAA